MFLIIVSILFITFTSHTFAIESYMVVFNQAKERNLRSNTGITWLSSGSNTWTSFCKSSSLLIKLSRTSSEIIKGQDLNQNFEFLKCCLNHKHLQFLNKIGYIKFVEKICFVWYNKVLSTFGTLASEMRNKKKLV